jgi:hypothetical protein
MQMCRNSSCFRTNWANACKSAVFKAPSWLFGGLSARIHVEMQAFGSDREKKAQITADLQLLLSEVGSLIRLF